MTDQTQLSLVRVPCPCCGSDDARAWGSENGFEAVKCRECGMVYVAERPGDEEIGEAIMTGQHRNENGTLSVVYKPSRRKLARYRARMASILEKDAGTEPVSWLDVGAGFGEMIEALQMVLPARSRLTGIEPMRPKADHARSRGLPIFTMPLSEVQDSFDFVSLINVFSHLPDPSSFFLDLKRLVKPGGTLVIVTGNGGDLDSAAEYPDRLDLPDHLVFAGAANLEAMLRRAGFEPYRRRGQRLDTLTWCLKSVVKKALGQPVPIALPYMSRFRDMTYLARRVD